MQEFEDQFNLGPHSQPTGQHTPEGQEIRFVGQPILALNPATNDLLGVGEFNSHPLVAGRYFYTLPAALWQALLANLGEEEFDAEKLRLEQALSRICGDHSAQVGVWRNRFVEYRLRPMAAFPIDKFSDEEMRDLGMNPLEIRDALRLYADRDAAPFERFRQGYAGWLLTNQQFLGEHDALIANHRETVRSRWCA